MPVIFIIFGILFIVTLTIIVVHTARGSKLKQTCEVNSDCPKGYVCIPNPQENNEKQCVPSGNYFCKIDPPTELRKCKCTEVDENGVCLNSTDCDKCLNNPKFSCIQVSDKNPYSWKQGDKKVNIPNSPNGYGWCLPDIVNRDITCNPYTSEYILAEVGDNQYEWGCYCKYPNLFGNGGQALSNCDFVYACGSSVTDGGGEKLGNLMVPTKENKKCHKDNDCGSGEKCLDPLIPPPCGYDNESKHIVTQDCEKSDSCVCHTNWAGEYTVDTNPLEGQCVCDTINGTQLDYQCVVRSKDYYEMNCVKGFCNTVPGAKTSNEKCNPDNCYNPDPDNPLDCLCCDCPDGYIRCPDDINVDNQGLIMFCKSNGPTCIKDPCSTPEVPGGYWNGQQCVCGTGYTYVEDENSAVGQICVDPCAGNGPCGNRGICYFPSDAKDASSARCCDCACPYTNEGDDSCTCSGTTKVPEGGNCCHNDDCCSGNCEGECHHYKIGKDVYGTCVGPDLRNSSCDAPDDQKCKPKSPKPPVTCDDNKSQCPYDSICCKVPDSDTYNCCPYSDGVCCDDGSHCCPSNYPVCDSKQKLCKTKDGKDSIPWTKHS